MGFAAIKKKAHALFDEAGFISSIADEADYARALALMDELVEDYDAQRPLIGILSDAIERWENESGAFAEFNARIAGLGGRLVIVRGEEDLSVAEQAHLFHYGRRCYVDLADRIAELLQRVAADD